MTISLDKLCAGATKKFALLYGRQYAKYRVCLSQESSGWVSSHSLIQNQRMEEKKTSKNWSQIEGWRKSNVLVKLKG